MSDAPKLTPFQQQVVDADGSRDPRVHADIQPADLTLSSQAPFRAATTPRVSGGCIIFTIPPGVRGGHPGGEMLRIEPDGKFYVKGVLVERDLEVYAALCRWLGLS